MISYAEFLTRKQVAAGAIGIDVDLGEVHTSLHPWQRRIVTWAIKNGRSAIWADTGLGKTRMQIEWARLSGRRALIVAPLAVCAQTVKEAETIGVSVRYVRADETDTAGIRITNYEIFDRIDPAELDAVVLDESSILKDVTSKTRDKLISHFAGVPRRLACSATPAPNDVAELANHAEFLGRASRREMLSTYFVHDQDGWRAKGHARKPMFAWMSGWAIALRRPSDIGYSDDGYILPPLQIVPEYVKVDLPAPEGELFPTTLGGVGGRAAVRRATMADRCSRAAELALAEPDEAWLMWCGLNDEAQALAAAIPGAVNVHGSMKPEQKAELLLAFAAGQIRYLITKPGIAAFGLNWQHCARMVFVGLSDSYEAYYQAIRRCYRYGQTRPVRVHIVLSELEGQIAANITRKEREAAAFTGELVEQMRAADHWSAAA